MLQHQSHRAQVKAPSAGACYLDLIAIYGAFILIAAIIFGTIVGASL